MENIIVQVKNVTKVYKRINFPNIKLKTLCALSGFDMEIRQGDIYGFVGANGAGKTTLIRVIAGLVEPTLGDIELFGEKSRRLMYKQRCRINGIIEHPALDPSLTAQDNLEICRIQRGIKDKGCIDEALKKVGLFLGDIKGLKVRNFSLGMKQRLGIAKALLGNPEFLFLDEPLNGLDPPGIRDFRKLIKSLNHCGITILISSHLLNELDQTATCYGFVHKGKMLEQILAEDLAKRFNKYMLLKVDNVLRAEKILRESFGVSRLEVASANTIHLYEQLDSKAKIVKAFAMQEISVEEITIKGEDLESYYMSLIGKSK